MTDEDVNPTTEELLNAECEKLAKERDQAIHERNEMAVAFLAIHAAMALLHPGPLPALIVQKANKALSYVGEKNEELS